MIEIIQDYWQAYLWSDGRMSGVAMTLWLLIVSIAFGTLLVFIFAVLSGGHPSARYRRCACLAWSAAAWA